MPWTQTLYHIRSRQRVTNNHGLYRALPQHSCGDVISWSDEITPCGMNCRRLRHALPAVDVVPHLVLYPLIVRIVPRSTRISCQYRVPMLFVVLHGTFHMQNAASCRGVSTLCPCVPLSTGNGLRPIANHSICTYVVSLARIAPFQHVCLFLEL